MGKNPKEASSYEILYTKAADKFLKTHEDVRQKYEENMHELLIGEHPESVDVKKTQRKKSVYFRMRIGEHRIVFTVVNGKIIVVTTLLAGVRGDVGDVDSAVAVDVSRIEVEWFWGEAEYMRCYG